MPISYQKLKNGDYTRKRGKTWTCYKCGQKNAIQSINPRSGQVQECSKCGTPKPMVFGVGVCKHCKTSDQVHVVPLFDHNCPSCGSPDMERFYPINDEALEAGIHPKYKSLNWKCVCGNSNPFPYANCLQCGLSIDKGLNKTSSELDDPNEKSKEIAKKMRSSNWKCPYCGRTNRGADSICESCGNNVIKPEDYVINQIRPEHFTDNNSETSQGQEQDLDSIHKIPEGKKFEFPPVFLETCKSLLAGVASLTTKVWWAIPFLFLILLIMSNYKEEEFIITDMKYNTSYIIEKYTTTHHTGESSYPTGAYNIVESQESRWVPDDDDDDDDDSGWSSGWGSDDDDSDWSSDWGSDDDYSSGWSSDWDSDDDWSSDWDSDWSSDDDWGSDWNNYGGDYFDSIIHLIRRLRSSIQTYTRKVLARIEYYTVYSYDIDEWVYSRTINHSGGKDEINHESELELAGNERVGSSSITYTIYLKKQETDKLYTLKVTEKEWQQYEIGDTIRVKTLFGYPQFITQN